jgi:hypothetical protein
MIRVFLTSLFALLLTFSQAQDKLVARDPVVITGQLIKKITSLKDMPVVPLNGDVKVRDEKGIIRPEGVKPKPFEPVIYPDEKPFTEDPALQKDAVPQAGITPDAAVTSNFLGMGYTAVNPPDPSICVGPNHIIQMINGPSGAYFKVSNKTGGQVVAQTYMDNITGRGGLGDPIALYDQFADRFIITEFANAAETGSEGLVFAVSQTNNPAGAWFVYYYSTGTVFPDYPKFSIWTDAIYGTTNDFTSSSGSYFGSSVYAFNKAAMYAGSATAAMQTFRLGSANKFFSMSPVLLQGTATPAAGTGGLIAYMADDAWTATTADIDSVGLYEFKVNFSNPALTTVTTASTLAVAAYNSTVCTAFRGQCIPMPGTSLRLEALQGRLMNQPVYRNFGSYEGIVFNHVVDKGSSIAGIRWYELRKSSASWFVNQQSTYSPDNNHRWMAGICYDQFGNIGLAYNVSSSTVRPGIRFTGRKVCDANNIMTEGENIIINGTASSNSTRYGDYSHVVADPDGIRFWVTAEYNAAANWSTRIAAFTLNQCTPQVCTAPTGLFASSITTSSANVNWSAVAGAVSYTVEFKPASSAVWIAAGTTASTSASLTGLTTSTLYDWRVRTNCSASTSGFSAAQFTSASPATCDAPTGLASSGISEFGATVSWAPVPGATGYTVEIKQASSATWIFVASTANTSLGLSNLTASTLYDWRVRTICATLNSTNSAAQFTTLAPPFCAPASGLAASSITTSSATLSFAPVSGAASYLVEIKPTTSSTWTVVSFGGSTTVSATGLSPSTAYDWRVQTNCPATSSTFSLSQFTTAAVAACDAPVLLTTDNITSNSAFVSWLAVANAVNYTVEFKPAGSATWISAGAPSTFQFYFLSGLAPSTLYDWRVLTNCTTGSSVFAATQFTTTAVTTTCAVPTGLSGFDDCFEVGLYWNAVPGALSYRVEYKRSTSTTWIVSETATTNLFAFISGTAGTYNWRVQANCNGAVSDFANSTVRILTAAQCLQKPEVEVNNNANIKVAPQPADNELTISYRAAESSPATIHLISQTGAVVLRNNASVIKGTNAIRVNISKLAPGTYILRLIMKGKIETAKVIIE